MSTHGGGAPDNRRRQSLSYPLSRITTNFPQSNGQQDVQLTYHPENLSGPHPQSDVNDVRYSPQQNVFGTEDFFDGTDGAGQIHPTADPSHRQWSVLFGGYLPSTNVEAHTQQEETTNTGWSLDAPDWRDRIDSIFPPTSPFAQSSTLHSPPADSSIGYSSGHSSSAMSISLMDSPYSTSRGSSALGYDARRSSADLESPASRRHMEMWSHPYSSRSTNTGLPVSAPPYVTAFPNSYNATTSNNGWSAEASTSVHAALPQTSPPGMDWYPPGSLSPSRFNSSSPWSGIPSSSGSNSHQYHLPELELEVSRRHSSSAYGSSDPTSGPDLPNQSTHRHSYSDDRNSLAYATTSQVYGSSGPELPLARPTHQHSYSDGPTYATSSQQTVRSSMPTTVPLQSTSWQGSPMDIASALPTHSPYYHPLPFAPQSLVPDSKSGLRIPFPPHYPDPTLRLPSREYKRQHRKRGTYKTKVKSADGIARTGSEEYRYNVENGEFNIITGNPDEQGSPPRPQRRKRGEGTRRKGGGVVVKVACKACSRRHYRCEQDEGGARCGRCIADGLECVYGKKAEKGKGGSTKGKGE